MTWQPTWRRLVASTLVCFALVLALLAWRVQTGRDPALGSGTSGALTTTATTTTTDDATAGASASPSSDSPSGSTALPSTGAS